MQEFDTISMSLPASSIRKQRQSIWIETTKLDQATGQVTNSLQIPSKALPIGVSKLATGKGGRDYQLTFSAKVLGPDYLQGITLNNWDRVIDSLDSIIEIDKNQVFDQSKVFTCDTTNNLLLDEIGQPHKQVYLALLAARANMNFLPITYVNKKKQGVEFRGVQQEKNRMIVYSKHLDLQKYQNKEFRDSLGTYHVNRLIEESKKQIRFEVNHTTLRSIRDRFKVHNNYLQSVLQSKIPVNHNFLKKILNITDIKQTPLFGEWEEFKQQGKKGSEFVMYKGIQSIIKELDYSLPLVKIMFKDIFESEENYKNHFYKKKNNIKEILLAEQAKQFEIKPEPLDNVVNKVLNCLYKAVA